MLRRTIQIKRWEIVTTDHSYDEIQEALIEAIEAIDTNLDEVLREVSPHELPGKMGYSDSPIDGYDLNQLTEETSKLLQKYQAEVKDADSTAELLIGVGQVTDSIHDAEIEFNDQLPVPDSILEAVAGYTYLLDHLSRQCSDDLKTAAEGFVLELYRQNLLSTACRVIIAYFTSDEIIPINYANTATTDVVDLFEAIQTNDESEFEIQELAEIYRRCSIYYETALPPLLALVDVLEHGEAELEKIRTMQLANSVSKTRNFTPLQVFVKQFDTNIRNAVDHGRISSYNPNPRREVVEFVYEMGDERVSKELSYGEFRKNTLDVCYASMTVYGMPVYILLMYPYLLILDEHDKLDLR